MTPSDVPVVRGSARHRLFIEVTDTLASTQVSGFPRHTRELTRRLVRLDHAGKTAWEVVPVVWAPRERRFRTLNSTEWAALDGAVETSRQATPRPAASPTMWRRVGRRVARHGPVRRVVTIVRAEIARRRSPPAPPDSLITPVRGDIWFDLEACWNDQADRSRLLPDLSRAGVASIALVADVMPFDNPEWFDDEQVRRFRAYIGAHVVHSVGFVCISRFTADTFAAVAARCFGRTDVESRSATITLGADFAGTARAPAPERGGGSSPLLLTVGTIEPRKNVDLLLDLWPTLAGHGRDLQFVVVGGVGWKSERTVERLVELGRRDPRFRWCGAVPDAELDSLYRRATVVLCPSWCEGLGVPVREALARGVPVISSDRGALREAGGSAADFVAPDNPDGWATEIERHLSDPAHHEARRRSASSTITPTWDDAAEQLVAALTRLGRPDDPS